MLELVLKTLGQVGTTIAHTWPYLALSILIIGLLCYPCGSAQRDRQARSDGRRRDRRWCVLRLGRGGGPDDTCGEVLSRAHDER